MRKIKKAAEFLLESGLLFEMNRQVLHPLGLALEVVIDDTGKISIGDIWDCREESEGIIFDDETFVDGKEKYDAYMEKYGNDNVNKRQETLGFVVQGSVVLKNDRDV